MVALVLSKIKKIDFLCINVAFMLLLLLCLPISNYPTGVDEELKSHVESFQMWGKMLLNENYEIEDMDVGILDFSSDPNISLLSDTIIGVCMPFRIPRKLVLISKDFWSYASDMQKEMVVFHELAHCTLNRGHRHAVDVNHVPVSLMYPAIFPVYWYTEDRMYFLKELFKEF